MRGRRYPYEDFSHWIAVDCDECLARRCRRSIGRPTRHGDCSDLRGRDERCFVFLLGQDRVEIERRAAGDARAAPAIVRGDGAIGGESELAGAEALRDSRRSSESVCDWAESTTMA